MPLKVLVVDDATFVRDMVKRTMRKLVPNVELHEAPDGARAMGLIKSKKPDIILSDWEMPQMGGDELLKWVREQAEFTDTPFIMITSRGDRNHVMKAVESGVSDYLSKPFTQEELTRKIGKQLKRIGFDIKNPGNPGNRGHAFGSIDVLTGGSQDRTINTPGQSAAGNIHPPPKTNPQPKKKANKPSHNFKGKAYLRFPHTTCECEIKELSLQAICVMLARMDITPSVFEQTSVDLISESGEAMARLNAYVHSIAAGEPNPDAEQIRIIARFVDQDPAKLEVLSGLME